MMSNKVKRLFAGFRPEHYEITLEPDPETLTVRGSVTIRGQKIGRPSQRLAFHQHGLIIHEAQITSIDKKGTREASSPSRINHHKSFDEVRLHAGKLLYPGTYEVTMHFSGPITRNMEGMYPCFFKQDGQEKKLIATQFESHHARDAFPCIDEPEAKATFGLTLISPEGQTALSNTPIKTQEVQDGKLRTVFEPTPKMSTYLLAFVFGELGFKEAKTSRGTLVRTYATPDNVQFTDFALDVAVRSLDFYEDYFGIDYPLAKCDLIALPDFASGAMENWGCITFREQCLFVDPANTSLPVKQYVAMVVAHELAHQWFGNLVTMRWWTDLWLNEGFASWIEYLATDKLFPEWQMWTQFIVDEQQPALKLDALANSHPIEVPINHPDEIRTIFDAISYNKGASVIHMLWHYLGAEKFRDGLRFYLKRHAYGNTDTIDLWDALEQKSHKPVKSFMSAWTTQTGYPIVHATVDNDSLELKQEQFLLNAHSREQDAAQQTWPIALGTGAVTTDIFATAQASLSLTAEPARLKLNSGQSGFYRVLYDSKHVTRLRDRIEKGELEPLDRLGVLSDSFEAAKAGYGSTVDALKLLEAFRHEDNSVVWDIIAANLGAIRTLMNDEAVRTSIKPYIRALADEQWQRLGWQATRDESHFDTMLRPTILGLMASADDETVLDEIQKKFDAMEKPEDLAPDLRGVIYTTAARHGNRQTFDKLFALYQKTTSSDERVTIACALTNFEQPELIERALSLIQSEHVRLQDVSYWIAYSLSNRFAKQTTWQWLRENWDWLTKNTGADLGFARTPLYVARVSSDAAFLDEFRNFFNSVMEPMLERTVKQGIEMIEWQSAWRSRDLKAIRTYLAPHSKK